MEEELSGGLTAEQMLADYEDEKNSQNDYSAYERKLAEEDEEEPTGIMGNIGDVVTGIGHGALDAVDETLQFGAGIVDGTLEKAGELVGQDWDIIDDDDYRGEIIQFLPKPVTTAGKIAEDLTQFGVGLIGAGKVTMLTRGAGLAMAKEAGKDSLKRKVGKGVNKALKKNEGGLKRSGVFALESASAALVVQDPYEDTLAEIMQETPELANPVAEFLSNKIDDSEFTMRLKNMGEDVILSVGIEGLVRLVKGTKNTFKPPKEVEKQFNDEVLKQQSEAEAAVNLKGFVDGMGDENAKSQIQHVLNAHQSNATLADYLTFLPKEELGALIKRIAPDLEDALYDATHLKQAAEKGKLDPQLGRTAENINADYNTLLTELGSRLEAKVDTYFPIMVDGEGAANVKGWFDVLKGAKNSSAKNSGGAAEGATKNADEGVEGASKSAEGEPPLPDIEPIPQSVMESIARGFEELKPKLSKLAPEKLEEQYMALIKNKLRGLSGKYWDSAARDKQITEHLRVHVLNPILKANHGTLNFQQVQMNLAKRFEKLAGVGREDLNAIVGNAAESVQEASEILMVQEIKINDAWKQMIKTMDGLKGITNAYEKSQQTARFLLEVTRLAEMSNVAQLLESSFGRGLGQRRMLLKSVDEMNPAELQKILNVAGKDPAKSQAQIDALIDNLGRANNDMEKTLKIAREFGKYQGLEKFMASMTEMWRGALLMNFSTNITNMLSGIAESFIIPVERIIGSALMRGWDPSAKAAHDQAWLHLRNMMEGYKHGMGAMSYSFKHEVQALDPFKGGMIETPGKGMGDMTHAEMSAGSPFQMTAENWGLTNDSFLGQVVNGVGKTFRMSFRFLGAQDELIKQATYFSSLKSKIQMDVTRKIVAGEITKDEGRAQIIKRMKEHFKADGFSPKMGKDGNLDYDTDAINMARDVTHTKEAWDGSIVKSVQTAVNSNPALGVFLPFIRTPSDLINKAYQRTPVLGGFSKRMQQDWKAGGTLRAQAIGRQAVGTGIVGMGYMAVMDGKLTGKGPDDPRANKIWRQTHQPNSILVDGKWVSYNKADPCGMLLGVLANGAEAARNQALTEGTDAGDVAQATILAVTATIGDKSSLRGLINLTTLFSDQVIGKDEATENILEDHVASWVPSILTQVSGAFEDTSYIKEADGFVEKLMRKSPWHQQDLPDRYNWITGQKEKIPTGNSWGIPVKEESHDWVLKELGNLNHGFSGPTRSFGGIDLSTAQFSEWSQLMGTVRIGGHTLMQTLQREMKGRMYDYDPNRQYFQEMYGEEPLQVKLVKRIMRRYKAVAKQHLIRNNPNLTPQQEDFSDLFGGG